MCVMVWDLFFTTNPIPAQEAVEVVQVQLMVSPLTLVG